MAIVAGAIFQGCRRAIGMCRGRGDGDVLRGGVQTGSSHHAASSHTLCIVIVLRRRWGGRAVPVVTVVHGAAKSWEIVVLKPSSLARRGPHAVRPPRHGIVKETASLEEPACQDVLHTNSAESIRLNWGI